ncbi:MAG: hypothetical protein Kow0089_23150 [Desulfobulbaceae bacterium]
MDPDMPEAYLNRGEVLTLLGRSEEAAADIREARSLLYERDSEAAATQETPAAGEGYEDLTRLFDDELDFEDDQYDYVFSDDSLAAETLQDITSSRSAQTGISAIVEYLDGTREEIPWAFPFEPDDDSITLRRDEEGDEETVSLERLACVRLTRAPADCPRNKDSRCHVEIIETIDGNIYHEAIHPEQKRGTILFGFSTKKETRFKYTLIPRHNIKKRFQRRHLGQILLDRQLVTPEVLQGVLREHNELKKVKLGQIIAEQAKLIHSAVEREIQKAYENKGQQLRVGEILLKAGLVDEVQVDKALAHQKRLQNRKLGLFLVEKGILQEKDLYQALAEKFRIPFVDLRSMKGSKKIRLFSKICG